MTVQELLKNTDVEKVCAKRPLSYRANDADYDLIIMAHTKFLEMLQTLTPAKKEEEYVILGIPYLEDDCDDKSIVVVSGSMFKKEDLNRAVLPDMKLPELDDIENMSKEEVDYWFETFKKIDLPTSYGYEFSPWEENIGCEVWTDGLSEEDICELKADIINELTFNGLTRESQEERRAELDASIQEMEEINALPEEERAKHFISHEDLMKELGWKDTRTQEEKDAEMLRWHRQAVWSCVVKYNAIKRYKNAEK